MIPVNSFQSIYYRPATIFHYKDLRKVQDCETSPSMLLKLLFVKIYFIALLIYRAKCFTFGRIELWPC